jgi:hypothetical protein
MRTHLCLALVASAAILASSAQAKIERVVEKTFSVQPGGLLTIETQGGFVRLETNDGPEVKVTAKEKFRTDSETEADNISKRLKLSIEQNGNDVSGTAKFEGERAGGFHWGSWPPVEVDFVVSLPKHYNGNLKTSGGDIVVGDLDGELRAHTSGGNLKLAKITGAIDGETSGGDISLEESTGRVQLTTSGGTIRVKRAAGEVALKTSGGNIQVEKAGAAVQADTSGGNISVAFTEAPKAACSLKTSGGNVRISVPPTSNFDLDASTSGGDVTTSGIEVKIEHGGQGKSRIAGPVNAGGPVLKLRTSGGNVRVAAN